MKVTTLDKYTADAVSDLLSPIPFFSDLALHSNQQYELLLKNSSLIELPPGKTIIEKGAIDNKFYFLLKGKLDVFPDKDCHEPAISQLSSGQVLGALAIINNQPRTASLAAAKVGATLIATDFTIFGRLDDFSQVTLETKLSLLRIVVNNARWKLEVYKMNDPDHPLTERIEKISNYQGPKITVDELKFLAEQAKELGDMLGQWNHSQLTGAGPKAEKKGGVFSILHSIRSSFS